MRWGALLAAAVMYATVFGNVRGIVHDPDHRPVRDAEVTLRARNSDWSRAARTSEAGEFEFTAVPAGEYRVRIEREGFQPEERQIVVASAAAPILHFPLQLAAAHETVQVTEQADGVNPERSAPVMLLGRAQIERTPGADRTNSLAMITDYVPGAYLAHDQLHVRGGHQVTWAVDGVPVPNTNIASNVGPQFDPKDADYIETGRGGYSAEYGDRTYAVFNVVPRTGFERNREGELVAGYGSFHQSNDQLSFGSHTERFAWYASVNANRTDLGLETPSPAILHDQAAGAGAFSTLIFNLNPANQFRLVSSLRRDDYQIPNNPDQQGAGIRDLQRESDAFVNFSWVRTAAHGLLLTVSPFYHFNRAEYAGGPGDAPVAPLDNRASTYAGAQITLAKVAGRHNARVGIYSFGQRDDALVGLSGGDLALRERQRPAGGEVALFAEDQYKATSWLTLNGGVRLTRFDGSLEESAADPRTGAALRIPRLRWVLRASYGRYYQPPPLSTVSGPLAGFALSQGFQFLPLPGERDEEREFGLTIPLGGWSLDVNNFRTRARNFLDHDVLGNSNLFFPVAIQGARIRGWETTLRSPRLFHRGQIHLAYSHQRAEAWGAVSGGLTDLAPPAGVFLLDHDQLHTLTAGFETDLAKRAWAAGNVYYGSGFADNGGPAHLPGHATMDLSLGKSLGEAWSVSLHALNVGNRRFLLDNSQEFGGRHFADPRQIFVQVRYRFHW